MYDTDKNEVLADVEPLLVDLADAFEYSIPEVSDYLSKKCPSSTDGYGRSTLIRLMVKQQLIEGGYELAKVANVGIEIVYERKYAIKVVRSDHGGNTPAPATISRASWYTAQPRLSIGDMDGEAFWSLKRLGLRGCDVDAVVLGQLEAKNDGLVHLIVDWREDEETGSVQMGISMPIGAWRVGETPRLAWRSIFEYGGEDGQGFVPTDEDIDFFVDDEGGENRVEAIVG